MADPTLAEVLSSVQALDAKVERVLRGLALLVNHLGAVKPATQAVVSSVATDAELDAADGDPEIRRDPSPKKWSGALHKGEHMSACEPDYLDALAAFLSWCAESDREQAAALPADEAAKKRKYAKYADREASLARGWAARKRKQAVALEV